MPQVKTAKSVNFEEETKRVPHLGILHVDDPDGRPTRLGQASGSMLSLVWTGPHDATSVAEAGPEALVTFALIAEGLNGPIGLHLPLTPEHARSLAADLIRLSDPEFIANERALSIAEEAKEGAIH